MVRRRFYSIMIIILSLAFIGYIAYQDNVLREEAMAEAYLNKIWIESDWAGETYKGFYFSFNKIEDPKCEGGLGTGDLYNIYGGSYLWGAEYNFSGTLHGNAAECRFVDCEGATGSMAFIFVNDSKIEATISYDGEDITEKKTFRPYNIKDIDDLTLQEESTVQVDLDHWGPVYFVAGIKSEEGNRWPRPRAYLVNGNLDVLCEFESTFQVGSKIYDVVFKDINGDGLKDAVVSTCFVYYGIEAEGTPHIHRLFLQTDNWFKCETAWIDPEEAD